MRDALLVLLSEYRMVLNGVNEYRMAVWMCRNKTMFDKKKLSNTDITNSFNNKIKARVGLDL